MIITYEQLQRVYYRWEEGCPRCRYVIVHTRMGEGKITIGCEGGCRITRGHSPKERGCKTPPMRKVTNLYHLRHIYGSSYFGSGGCNGRVKISKNAELVGSRDNGFVAGA